MKTNRTALVALSFAAFISLGLPDGLLGVAWPGIRRHFSLPVDALGLLLITSTAGYMTSSSLSGALVRRLGLGTLLAVSCAAAGVALAAYSVAPAWWVFVSFGLLAGAGGGAIDAGLNTYVDRHHGPRLMQWLHASFGVGIALGPAIMTTLLSTTGRWQPGYQAVAAAQLLLAATFALTRSWWELGGASRARTGHPPTPPASAPPAADPIGGQPTYRAPSPDGTAPLGDASLWQSITSPSSLASILLFFLYTGCELGVGLWAYTLLTESRAVHPTVAGVVTGSYWASFTVGRVLAGLLSDRIQPSRLVGGAIALAVGGMLLVWLDLGRAATVTGIALTGFVIAPVFPGLMSDTRYRVPSRHLTNTIGMQIAGAGLGAAVLPALAGVTARVYGLEAIPVYLVSLFTALLVLYVAVSSCSQRQGRRR